MFVAKRSSQDSAQDSQAFIYFYSFIWRGGGGGGEGGGETSLCQYQHVHSIGGGTSPSHTLHLFQLYFPCYTPLPPPTKKSCCFLLAQADIEYIPLFLIPFFFNALFALFYTVNTSSAPIYTYSLLLKIIS